MIFGIIYLSVGRTDGQAVERTGGRTAGRTDEWAGGQSVKRPGGRTVGRWEDGRKGGRTVGRTGRLYITVNYIIHVSCVYVKAPSA